MKFLLPLVVLLLAACTGGTGNPALDAVQARADLEMANIRRAEARRAEVEAARQAKATQLARVGAAEREYELLYAAAAIQLTQVSAESTSASSAATAFAATAAPLATAAEATRAAPEIAATATKVMAMAQIEAARERRNRVIVWLWPPVIPLTILLAVLTAWGVWAIRAKIEWFIEKDRNLSSIREVSGGTAILVWRDGQAIWETMDGQPAVKRNWSEVESAPRIPPFVSPNGVTAVGEIDRTLKLIDAAIEKVGEQSAEFPSCKELEWSGGSFHRALEPLIRDGFVWTDNQGTWLHDHISNLASLRSAYKSTLVTSQ